MIMGLILEVSNVWASSDVTVFIVVACALTIRVVFIDCYEFNLVSCDTAFEVISFILKDSCDLWNST